MAFGANSRCGSLVEFIPSALDGVRYLDWYDFAGAGGQAVPARSHFQPSATGSLRGANLRALLAPCLNLSRSKLAGGSLHDQV